MTRGRRHPARRRAKPVQISIVRELLARIDRDPQTKKQGRSAFVRDAVELYFAVKHRREVDRQIAAAFGHKSHDLLADVEAWIEEQAWPEKRSRRRFAGHRPRSSSESRTIR
jgi:predicted RNA-binding protein YlxR (DUF448 family)